MGLKLQRIAPHRLIPLLRVSLACIGKIKEPNLLKDAGGATLLAVTKYAKGDLGGAVSSIFGLGKKIMGGQSGADEKTKMQNTSAADVIMWSGCKDDQTSADAQEAGQATGESLHRWHCSSMAGPFYPERLYTDCCLC